jgi:hypothetical protein
VEKEIYTQILHAVFADKKSISVWTDSKNKRAFLKSIDDVTLVDNPKNADFLIIANTKDIDTKGIKFATTYKMIKHHKDDILGGFYWQKGRPNIIFLRPYLSKENITLPKSMHEYIENKI